MAEHLPDDALLLQYLDGDLEDPEKHALEARLQSDTTLRHSLLQLQVARQAILHYGTALKVASVHEEVMQEQRQQQAQGRMSRFRRNLRFTLAAAATLVVLSIGIILFLTARPSPDKLYRNTFVDFTVSATRSAGSATSVIETLYAQKKYAAIANGVGSRSLSARDSLLTGLAYLHLKKTDTAVRFFERMAVHENDYRQDAEFYLALSFLQAGNYAKAVQWMQKIAGDPAHLYHAHITTGLVKEVRRLQR